MVYSWLCCFVFGVVLAALFGVIAAIDFPVHLDENVVTKVTTGLVLEWFFDFNTSQAADYNLRVIRTSNFFFNPPNVTLTSDDFVIDGDWNIYFRSVKPGQKFNVALNVSQTLNSFAIHFCKDECAVLCPDDCNGKGMCNLSSSECICDFLYEGDDCHFITPTIDTGFLDALAGVIIAVVVIGFIVTIAFIVSCCCGVACCAYSVVRPIGPTKEGSVVAAPENTLATVTVVPADERQPLLTPAGSEITTNPSETAVLVQA